jgi:hypothetical protein
LISCTLMTNPLLRTTPLRSSFPKAPQTSNWS